MSDSEEDVGSIGKQKSIFSGMGRVKQINHLWSPKSKPSLSPDRSDAGDSSPSPVLKTYKRRSSSSEKSLLETPRESGRRSFQRTLSANGSSKHLVVENLERYLAINSWLEHNGINVAGVATERDMGGSPKRLGLLDEMYCSLETLESAVESELAQLHSSSCSTEESTAATKDVIESRGPSQKANDPLSPALFDYLTVIGADVIDVTTRNYWNQRENVFEATVAFAHPPESQFYAESLEHFCFPAGVHVTNANATGSPSKDHAPINGRTFPVAKQGDFFVLMLSGGGVQGQSVQYAMCMKGMVTFRSGDGCLAIPICYCIVVQVPYVPFFRGVLQGLLGDLRRELISSTSSECTTLSNIVTNKHSSYIDEILRKMNNIRLPGKGRSTIIDMFPASSPELTLTRPHEENGMDEKTSLLLQWSLPLLLSHLSIDRVLQILGFLLVEMKVIVVSDEIALLSSATLALASLVHPLTWAGPVISVLPPYMHEYMEAPVPLICGIDELPHNFECSKGTCILYPEHNRVKLHTEDEWLLEKLEMPECTSLRCDLTRFTKEMFGGVEGVSRDKVVPLSIHLVIHRVRRHIEDLIRICAHTTENGEHRTARQFNGRELRFIGSVRQTQMYQKYRDDEPLVVEQDNQQSSSIQASKDPAQMTASLGRKQRGDLKEAASMLFQIAVAGVSSSSLTHPPDNAAISTVADTNSPIQDVETLPNIDELTRIDLCTVNLPSAASTPTATARMVSSVGNSPKEKIDSPIEVLHADTHDVESAHGKRRLDRAYVWAIDQPDLDVASSTEVLSAASPSSAQCSMQHSPPATIEAPCHTMNNGSNLSGGGDVQCWDQSEQDSISYSPRGDTETTISLFDVALSEIFGHADTDYLWMFEPPDEPVSCFKRDEDTEDERTSQRDTSVVEDDTLMQPLAEDTTPKQNQFCVERQQIEDEDDGISESFSLDASSRLTSHEAKILTMGVRVDSRGAWDGWCEGQLFVTPDLSTLSWERRAVSFAALNMYIANITGILVDSRTTTACSHEQELHLHFGKEVIRFQFPASPLHNEFVFTLRHLVQPTQVDDIERKESYVSPSEPVTPYPVHHPRDDSFSKHDDPDSIVAAPVPIEREADMDHFKARLQQGFLVEKHGRLGKPHAKIIFTDAQCSHIMWRTPPAELAEGNNQLYRPGRFSQNKSISVESITAIVTGKQTAVLRRAVASKANERLCLSVLTPTRTLDMCAYSLHGFQELYRGLSMLLDETHRARMD